MDDVVLNKVAALERCVQRIQTEYGKNPQTLATDFTRQDSIVLNIQRACETSIDLAMHLCRMRQLGVPQDSRSAFDLLEQGAGMPAPLAQSLRHMEGFRNIAVHDYQRLNLDIVRAIIERHLVELQEFGRFALRQSQTD